jgi:hypothetical protein
MSLHHGPSAVVDFAWPIVPAVPEHDLRDYLRLSREVETILSANSARLDGRDRDVEELAAFCGLKRSDALVLPVRLRQREVVFLIARSQTWRRAKDNMIALKRACAHAGRRLVLVPAGWVRRPTFLVNCAIIGSSASTQVTATLRLAVLDQLMFDPTSSLRDCAACLDNHEDPVGAVLAMVGQGFLKLDLRKQISPETLISLA